MYQRCAAGSSVYETVFNSVRILYEDGVDVVELRVFGKRKIHAGFFDDLDALATQAAQADDKGFDVYVTLNPCKDACIGRADNDLIEIDSKRTPLASDTDIERRKWILIDCDPERPSKVSSTEGEKRDALDKAREVREWLNVQGINSVLADSGNGAHLLAKIDLPNDPESRSLVERFLKALSFKFSDSKVKIDKSTFNAARITKAYGVHARKGQNVERKGRIHRPSAILETPAVDTVATVDQLEAVAGELPEDPPNNAGSKSSRYGGFSSDFDLHQWVRDYGVPVKRESEWGNGGYRWILEECIWLGHADNSAYIVRGAHGGISAGCQHNSCKTEGNRWNEVREHYQPGAYSRKFKSTGNSGNSGNSGNGVEDENVEPWTAPAAFHSYDLPEFPKDIFPKWMSDFTEALSVATQTPRDLPGMLGLTVGAVASAKLVEVEVWDGWREPTNLFTASVLRPGTRKTEVFKRISRPVVEYEKELVEETAKAIAKAYSKYRIYEGRLKRAEQQAAKAEDHELEDLETKSCEAAEDLASIDIPSEPQLLADDASPERLASILAEQGGRVALMSDEGGVFDMMAGRYSQGIPNLDVYLKGHAGVDLRVDRVGRPADRVRSPALTIGLAAVQPDVLRGLASKPGFRGRGLLGRSLY